MSFFKKALFWMIAALLLIVGVNSTVDAWFTKQIVWWTQYQNTWLVQYTISYTNTWVDPITVRLGDVLPAELMPLPGATASCGGVPSPWATFTVSMWWSSYSTNFCTLQPWQTATLDISALIVSQSFSDIINIANVEEYSWAVFITTNTASATFSSYPVLSISKAISGNEPQQLWDLVSFDITITNSWAADANNIVVTDAIPNGFQYSSSNLWTPTLDVPNNTASWVVPTIPANSTVVYTVTIQLMTNIPWAWLSVWSTVVNTWFLMTWSTSAPWTIAFSNDFSEADFSVAGIPSVFLTKTIVSANSGNISQSWDVVGYQIVLTNTGTDIAVWNIIDILPSELTWFTSSLPPSNINGYTWEWTWLSINPWSSITISVSGVLLNTYQTSTVFTNAANFFYTWWLPGLVTNNGTVAWLILWTPNIALDKSLIQYSTWWLSWDVVVYAITLTNTSNTPYTWQRCVVDTYPADLWLLSSSIPQSNCASLSTSQIGFSGTGLPATIILTWFFNSNILSWTVITNSAQVYMTGNELFSWDNFDQVSFTISNFDLFIQKTVASSVYTWTPWTPVVYTINYGNNGWFASSGVVVSDVLPLWLTYWSLISGIAPIVSGQTLTWSLPSLQPWQTWSLSFSAIMSGYIQGIFDNTATISSLWEINLTNNTSTVSFNSVPAPADVVIQKTLQSQWTYVSWSQYTFVFDVVNNGWQTATGVVVSDVFPSIFSFVSWSTSLLNASGNNVWWSIIWNTITSDSFVLSPWQTWSLSVVFQLNDNILTSSTYINTWSISTLTQENQTNNNISTVNFNIIAPVVNCSWLTYWISLISPLQNPTWLTTLSGQSVQYTYSVTNNYNIPLEIVSINTTWPSQVSIPNGLVWWNIVSNVVLPALSGNNFVLTGSTIVDGITNITTPATFTLRVPWWQPFTCNANSSLAISQTCGNGFINSNLWEQCENYNGWVIVWSGQTFDPNSQICNSTCRLQTTRVVNCANMTVNGVQETSCVPLDAQPELPLLTIDKRVNGQKTITSSVNSVVTYSVSIRNNSADTAYNVTISDLFPWNQMQYVGPISIVPSSYNANMFTINTGTQFFSGNIGNIAPGVEVIITFPARVISNSFNTINNIVNVTYTNSNNVVQPQLTSNATITQGSSSMCGNGIKDANEQCDIGTLPWRIGNYLDNSTSFPSYPYRNQICNQYCQIENSQASRCGDGILWPLEQCDMWTNWWTIGSYLNTNGQLFPSGIYQNRACTSSCVIEGPWAPVIPACWYTDSIISVMKDEYLPLAWELELWKGNIVQTANQCWSNDWALIEDSVECEFHLYGPWDESNGRPPRVVKRYGNGCDIQNRHDNKFKLFNDFSGPNADPLFVKDPRWTDYIKLDDSIVKNTFGEYKISLARVDYQYCRNWLAVAGNPYARVCQIDVAVTDHYLMQKGSVSQLTNTDLSRYFMIGGESLYSYIQLDQIDKISNLNYANISASLNSYTNALTTKYDKIAVPAKLGTVDLKKVPGKSIYIVNGNANFDALDALTIPTTIIVKWDATIQWDVKSNILLIAQGKVKFNIKKDNTWANGCNTQVIRGIVVAQWWFLPTDNNGYQNNNLDSHVRCRKWNLHVYWVLVWNKLNDVVQSRRSHLEHWFTFERNWVNFNWPTDERIKTERRDEIYKWASVYIEQNPSLWRSMPPEASEFLNKLNISRS